MSSLVGAFLEGGWNMFVLLGIAIVVVVTAVRFARDASPQRLALIRALSWAQVAASFTGFFIALAHAAKFIVRVQPADPDLVLLQGFAESTANLGLGGLSLVLTWILVAVGIRRMTTSEGDTP